MPFKVVVVVVVVIVVVGVVIVVVVVVVGVGIGVTVVVVIVIIVVVFFHAQGTGGSIPHRPEHPDLVRVFGQVRSSGPSPDKIR